MKRGVAFAVGLVLGVIVIGACGGPKVETAGAESVYAKAQAGDSAEVISAVRRGLDVNRPDENGKTLMHYAVIGNKPDLVESLLEEFHANPRIKDKDGKTPLDYVSAQHGGKIARLLAEFK